MAAGDINLLMSRTAKDDYQKLQTMVVKQTPSPGHYDNFQIFQDRSKMRSYSLGKKLNAVRSLNTPGPGNYETTRANSFSTRGGAKFGTEQRKINHDVIKHAKKIPACTDYSPSIKLNKGKIKITFG